MTWSAVLQIWPVGVQVYVLFSGLNPFTAETPQQMIDNISNAEYSYDDETFKVPTVEALDFIKSELKRIEFEEKTRTVRKERTTTSHVAGSLVVRVLGQ